MKKKCSFAAYYGAILYPNRANFQPFSRYFAPVIIVLSAFCAVLVGTSIGVFAVDETVLSSYTVEFFLLVAYQMICAFAFAASSGIGNKECSSVTFTRSLPVKRGRRVLYAYMSAAAVWLTMTAFVVCVYACVYLFAFAIAIRLGGSSVLEILDFGKYSTGYLYVALYAISLCVLYFSAGMAVGFTRSFRLRLAFAIIAAVLIVANWLTFALPSGLLSPLHPACYEHLSSPWLYILIWAVLSLAALACSVFIVNRFYKYETQER